MDLPPLKLDLEIPLFPLPNCVLFPGVVQPLHIFEPRFRKMMVQTMAGQAALVMALLQPGWEKTYHGCPQIYPRVCLGRVIAHELLDDGKYNLLLQGVARADVTSEIRHAGEWGVYRSVMLRKVPDIDPSDAHDALQRRVLADLFEKSALRELTVTPALATLFEENVPLSRLIDGLAFSLVQDCQAKQRLLEEPDVAKRGELLLRELIALAARLRPSQRAAVAWPPNPGLN
ncbi:MAG TPA: LON peptidase substrate-binding domain-containing protein [Phycisphaerae bacterium]|nr:LON peptidase substrate-binding domain-containing protein [Phycisphaerae bacterium]